MRMSPTVTYQYPGAEELIFTDPIYHVFYFSSPSQTEVYVFSSKRTETGQRDVYRAVYANTRVHQAHYVPNSNEVLIFFTPKT